MSPNRCRVCLCSLDLTSATQTMTNLKEKFLYVTGIITHEEQPQVICKFCVGELEDAFKFKKKCEETEKCLLQEKVKLEMALEDFAQISAVEDFFKEVSEELIKREEDELENNAGIQECATVEQNTSAKKKTINLSNKKKSGKSRPKITKAKPDTEHEKLYRSCAICDNAYSITYLPVHLREVHGKLSNEFLCDICNGTFKGKASLTEHMKRKHMTKRYVCSYCKLTFPTSGMKRTHEIRYHTLEFSHHCGICNLKFINAVEYRKHITTHTGELNFSCDCGKKFARKQNLKTHMLTHATERAYKCETCGADFKTPIRLKVHLQSHAERMYECPVCQKLFIANQTLRRHVTKKHPDYKLPPPGTIMNKKSLEKILNLAKHLKMKVNEGKLSLPQLYETVRTDSLNAKSLLRTTII